MIINLLIISTIAILVSVIVIIVLLKLLLQEKKKNFEKYECTYTFGTKNETVTTGSGLHIDSTLFGWFCSHCSNCEENLYETMRYCPKCGRKISKITRYKDAERI